MYDITFTHPSPTPNYTREVVTSSTQPLSISQRYWMTMLARDKSVSCERNTSSNFTTVTQSVPGVSIESLPGATIISPILLSLTGVISQIIALVYLHRTSKPSYSRTVFSVFLSTLIWTDLMGKLITTPPAIVSYANGKWMGGERFCHFHGYCMMVVDSVTHCLVSAMAVDRFVCVRYGYFYKSNVTRTKARFLLTGLWLFCLGFCALPFCGLGEFELQYPGTWCFVNIHVNEQTEWHHRVYTNVFGLMTILNIFLICTCNIMVIGTLLSVRLSRTRKLSASSLKQRPISTTRELELQMSIVLTIITLVFVSSWLPLDIRLFLNQIYPHTCREEHVSDVVAVRMASFNQIVDPWAYIICRRVFSSKAWKYCRSILSGGSMSFKKNKNSTILQTGQNVERGESFSKVKLEEISSLKRRNSLPHLKAPNIASWDSVQYISELDRQQRKLMKSITLKIRKGNRSRSSNKELSAAMRNQDEGVQCFCRKSGVSGDIAESVMDELPIVPNSRLERRQFLLPKHTRDFTMDFSCLRRKKRKQISSRKSSHSYTVTPVEESMIESERDFRQSHLFTGRRHSWGSNPSSYKYCLTKSTQTLDIDKVFPN